jgi:hypothetical protein
VSWSCFPSRGSKRRQTRGDAVAFDCSIAFTGESISWHTRICLLRGGIPWLWVESNSSLHGFSSESRTQHASLHSMHVMKLKRSVLKRRWVSVCLVVFL